MIQRLTPLLFALVGVLVIGALLGAMLGGGWPGHMMWGWHGPYGMGYGAAGWLVMALVPLALLGAVLLGAVLVVRSLGASDQGNARQGSSMDILRRRFAAGEITREEYEQMRHVLEP